MTRMYIILAAIGGLIMTAFRFISMGKSIERGKQANDTLDRIQRGRDSIGDGDPDKRVRRNDGKWN